MDNYLTVTKWLPNFRTSRQKASTTLKWVKFRELPLEMFEEEALAGLGDLIGRTVKANPSQLKHIVEGMHMCVSKWT